MQWVRCCVFSLAMWLPLAVSVPGAAAAPVLASKGEAVHQALVCVSSQCGRLGSAGGCVALPPRLPASFSPASSIPYLPTGLSRVTSRAADFLFLPCLSRSRRRKEGLSSCLTWHLCWMLLLSPSVRCSPQTVPLAQSFEFDPVFILYSLGWNILSGFCCSGTCTKSVKNPGIFFIPMDSMSAVGGVD